MAAVGRSYFRFDLAKARAWVRRKLKAGLRVYVDINGVEHGYCLVAAPTRAEAMLWVKLQFQGMLPVYYQRCRMVPVKRATELV